MIQRDSLHRVYSCAQCAKSILTRARAFLSMQVPSFPQARLHGRGLSSVATAGTRRTPWKGSDRVELEWLERKSQNQSYSFVFFISFFCSNFQVSSSSCSYGDWKSWTAQTDGCILCETASME